MTHKKALKLFFQSFLLLLLLFALARMISHQSGMFAVLEMVVLVILLLLSVAGLSAYRNIGNKILFLIFLIYTVNVLLFKAENPHLVPGLLLVSLVGLLISMPRRARHATECVDCTCEEPMTSTPPPQKVVEAPVVQVEAGKEKAAPAKTKFTPGKYVASKRSNVYHEPKCEWAKKIQKARQIWFASREEALDKGYKKHDCVK